MFDLAIFYRMVGGFVGFGTSTWSTFWCRLRWALTLGAYMAFAAIVHHQPALEVLEVFLGVSVTAYLGRLIPHGLFEASASLKNSLGMAVVNVLRLSLILAPYAYFEPSRIVLVVCGLNAGVAYYIGWKWLNNRDIGIYFRNTNQQCHISQLPYLISSPVNPEQVLDQAAVGGGEWGEVLTGFMVYQTMYLLALVIS